MADDDETDDVETPDAETLVRQQLDRGLHPDQIKVENDIGSRIPAIMAMAEEKNSQLVGELIRRGSSEVELALTSGAEDANMMREILHNLGARAKLKVVFPPDAADNEKTLAAMGIKDMNYADFAVLGSASAGKDGAASLSLALDFAKGEEIKINPTLMNMLMLMAQKDGNTQIAGILQSAGAKVSPGDEEKYQKRLDDFREQQAKEQVDALTNGSLLIQIGCIGDRSMLEETPHSDKPLTIDDLLEMKKKLVPDNTILVENDCGKPAGKPRDFKP